MVSFLAFSNAVRLRINNPCVAESVVDMAITSGMATPSAWGQEVTMTVTILSRANDKSWPDEYHTIKVITPTVIETNVSHLATLSARFWVLDLAPCAALTIPITF